MSGIRPIGVVRGGRAEPVDDDWGKVEADIVLDAGQFSAESTAGLGDFSHLTVVYQFHLVPDDEVQRGVAASARPHRLAQSWHLCPTRQGETEPDRRHHLRYRRRGRFDRAGARP